MITAPARPGAHPASRADRGHILHTTSLVYLNNRHYDPTTGVFISVDPLVTKTMQPYIYGAANPVRYSDASGLEPRPIHEGINRRRTYTDSGQSATIGTGPSTRYSVPQSAGLTCRGGLSSTQCLVARLPGRHRGLLDQPYVTDTGADATGQIRLFGMIGVGPVDARAAEVFACDWNPMQCAFAQKAADYVNEVLPDAGDGSRNNAERHALLSGLYWLMRGDTAGPDAHENVVDGQLIGYLEDLRLMDLVNNEVGMTIAQDYSSSGAFRSTLGQAWGSYDYSQYQPGNMALLPEVMVNEMLGLIQGAGSDGRLVWVVP